MLSFHVFQVSYIKPELHMLTFLKLYLVLSKNGILEDLLEVILCTN